MSEERAWYANPLVLIGCGCGIGCLVIPVAFVALLGGGAAFLALRDGATQEAIAKAQANAEVVEQSVATPLEQKVNGVENMIYMKSVNANDGTITLTVMPSWANSLA